MLSSVMLAFFASWVALELMVVASQRLGIVLWAGLHMAFFVLVAGLEVGLLRICLTLNDGGDPPWRIAVSGLALGPKLLAAQFIYLGLVLFGLAMLVVPGIYLAARYSLFGFAVASGERNIMASLQESSALTAGVRGRLSVLLVALLLFNALGAALFGIGLLVTVPISTLTMTSVYRQLDEVVQPRTMPRQRDLPVLDRKGDASSNS